MLNVEGVAYSGGSGKQIQSVEISVDNGQTWVRSQLLSNEIPSNGEGDKPKRYYGWVRFVASINRLDIQKTLTNDSNLTVMCRATDDAGLMQPEIDRNEGGYLYNGWHKIQTKII